MSMPTQEWIDANKAKHGKLAKCTLGDQVYIYRKLKRDEHLLLQKDVFPNGVPLDPQMIKAEDNAAVEDRIIKTCVLWPEVTEVGKLDAGAPSSLVPSILFFSGFVGPQEPVEL